MPDISPTRMVVCRDSGGEGKEGGKGKRKIVSTGERIGNSVPPPSCSFLPFPVLLLLSLSPLAPWLFPSFSFPSFPLLSYYPPMALRPPAVLAAPCSAAAQLNIVVGFMNFRRFPCTLRREEAGRKRIIAHRAWERGRGDGWQMLPSPPLASLIPQDVPIWTLPPEPYRNHCNFDIPLSFRHRAVAPQLPTYLGVIDYFRIAWVSLTWHGCKLSQSPRPPPPIPQAAFRNVSTVRRPPETQASRPARWRALRTRENCCFALRGVA